MQISTNILFITIAAIPVITLVIIFVINLAKSPTWQNEAKRVLGYWLIPVSAYAAYLVWEVVWKTYFALVDPASTYRLWITAFFISVFLLASFIPASFAAHRKKGFSKINGIQEYGLVSSLILALITVLVAVPALGVFILKMEESTYILINVVIIMSAVGLTGAYLIGSILGYSDEHLEELINT